MDKQRLRFTVGDDITLIKEVLCENPFEDNDKWDSIQEKVSIKTNKMFSIRCLREHLQHLMVSFQKEENVSRKKSGTEEELIELKVLLHNVIDLANGFRRKRPCANKSMKKAKGTNVGEPSSNETVVFSQLNMGLHDESLMNGIAMEHCLVELEDPHVESTPTNVEIRAVEDFGPVVGKRRVPIPSNSGRKRNNVMKYLREKRQIDQSMKREELELQYKKLRLEEAALELEKERIKLEKDRLDFEKKKFDVESQERETRLNLEMDERKERLQGDREQRQMLLDLFKSAIGNK